MDFLVKLWKYLKIKSMIIWVNIKSGVYYLPPPGLLRPQAEATFCRVTAVSPMLAFYTEPPTVHTCTPSKHCSRLFILNALFWESSTEPASCCGGETGKRHNIRSTSLSSVGTLTQSAEGASWMMCQHSYSS